MEAERAPQNRMCPLLKSLCVGEDCVWYFRKGCAVMVLAGFQIIQALGERQPEEY